MMIWMMSSLSCGRTPIGGESDDAESTSGVLLELFNSNSGRRWPIVWAVRRQGSTSNSTADAAPVACSMLSSTKDYQR